MPNNLLGTFLAAARGVSINDLEYDEYRSTVIVYLFSKLPPQFPHAWLNVTDPDLSVGRITNFSGFGGDMVPVGQSCLCVEFFCSKGDSLYDRPECDLIQLALNECAHSGVIQPSSVYDTMVLRLPGADAATHSAHWRGERKKYVAELARSVINLYDIQRAGSDVATYAGLEAARSILSGDRSGFDRRADPTSNVW